MDYLQYLVDYYLIQGHMGGFKPYYKWITFNTLMMKHMIELL